jgi:mannosyltransferase OCH1-like enzyme
MTYKKICIYIIFGLLFILACFFLLKPFILEKFDKIPLLDIDNIQKKSNILLLHYGNINLDIKTFSENVKTYAKEQDIDYFNSTHSSVWQTMITIYSKYDYEYIFIVPTNAYIHNKSKNIRKLIEQSGEAHLILCRNEKSQKSINLDVGLFKNSDWTVFKLYDFYHKKISEAENSTDIILDQIYTNSKHKNFAEFNDYINLGIPYMLYNICIYNEHSIISSKSNFMHYYDKLSSPKSEKIDMYPWQPVKHPKFTIIEPSDVDNIKSEVKKDEGKIPKLIFQTMETNLLLNNVNACINQVKQLNQNYKYYYFTTHQSRNFIKKYYPDILEHYDALLPGAYKSDLWRYCILHKYGGFYMDVRMFPYMSFDSIVTKDTEFMSCLDVHQNMLYQAILGCVPGSKFMKNAIDECVENIKNKKLTESDLAVTGPRVMGNGLNKGLGFDIERSLDKIDDKKILLLHWDSHKNPKYLQDDKNLFACHKYTKLLSEDEVKDETTLWVMLSGKDHYSIFYNNKNVYKKPIKIQE